MKVTLRKKKTKAGYSLFLDIYEKGQRKKEYLNLSITDGLKHKEENKQTLELAEKIREKRSLELKNSAFGFIAEHKKKTVFINYYETAIKTKKNRTDISILGNLKAYIKGTVYLTNINSKWIKDFQNHLAEQKLNPNTLNLYINRIKFVLKIAKREKLINEVPEIESLKGKPAEKTFLSFEEIKMMFENYYKYKHSNSVIFNEAVRAFLFSCFTGLRFSDIKNLKYENITNDTIQIRMEKTSDFIYIPMHKTAKELILPENNIIPLPENKIFKVKWNAEANRQLKKWCKELKLNKHISFHSARHTFATLSLTLGADLYTVSKLLGHREIKTTQIYAKIVDAKKQQAIELLPYFGKQ